MEHRIIINLGEGTWQQGFPNIVVELWELDASGPTRLLKLIGKLPKSPTLLRLYKQWQEYYQALNDPLRVRQSRSVRSIEIDSDDITHISDQEFNKLCKTLEIQVNAWLSVESFINIDRQLRTCLDTSSQIQLVIEADTPSVRRFPWHLWRFLEDYPQAEVTLSTLEQKQVKLFSRTAQSQVRILSVLGDTKGIQVSKDREILEQLTGVFPVVLDKPSRAELDDHLWDETGWDILFFAGHSVSQQGDFSGQIWINDSESLSIAQLKYSLQTAIRRGLQLAIFNSCDGMGLARELADLRIPFLNVMRESVPDQVAQTFLMYFMRAFAAGIPFYLAVREARQRLQSLESEFPCASWLPVICQNSTAKPLTWQLLLGRGNVNPSLMRLQNTQSDVETIARTSRPIRIFSRKRFRTAVIVSVLVATLIIGVRSQGYLQPLELQAYDHMMQIRPDHDGRDERIVVITLDQEDIEYQREQGLTGGEASLKDQTLLQILKKLEPAQPAAIGLDIIHDFPFISDVDQYLNNTKNFVAICRIGSEKSDLDDVGPPSPDFPIAQLGFTNFPLDDDGTIRRQFLGMMPDGICQTDESFSFRLASKYIQKNANSVMAPERIDENNLQWGDVIFRKLNRRSGGYSLPPREDGGYQILTNYRSQEPEQISLRSFLTSGVSRFRSHY